MNNWQDEDSQCRSEQDWKDVQKVSRLLGLECRRINFAKEYWIHVFEPFLDGLKAGETPNPDIACNQIVKFGSLLLNYEYFEFFMMMNFEFL